jgi:hypothetical protein
MVGGPFTVSVGQMFTIQLNLTGNPLPTDDNATFFFNGNILDGNLPGIDLGADFFSIMMVTPMDNGTYMVSASNTAGVGSAIFELIVLTEGEVMLV